MAEKTVEAIAVPVAQVIRRFDEAHGVVLCQVTEASEAIANMMGVAYQKKNRYRMFFLPEGKHVLKSHDDTAGWRPTQHEVHSTPMEYFGVEESGFCERFLFQQARALVMPFKSPTGEEAFVLEKECAAGGFCCCPHTMNVKAAQGGHVIGRVQEDVHCGKNCCSRYLQALCLQTFFYDVEIIEGSAFTPKYQLQVGASCCGPHNNCFGATFLRHDAIFNIYPKTGNVVGKEPVAHLQKTYLKGDGSLIRSCFDFSNYMLEFPDNATGEEKALLVASALVAEFALFDRSGN